MFELPRAFSSRWSNSCSTGTRNYEHPKALVFSWPVVDPPRHHSAARSVFIIDIDHERLLTAVICARAWSAGKLIRATALPTAVPNAAILKCVMFIPHETAPRSLKSRFPGDLD